MTIQAGHAVIRSGPYRVLRHPAYAGALLALVGIGVVFGSWPALALCVLPIGAALVHRIRVEEAALEGALGDAYRDYARSTRQAHTRHLVSIPAERSAAPAAGGGAALRRR